MKKVYVYDPTASDFQSAVRGVGRYLQILKENFSKEFKFISNIENCLPAGKTGKLKIKNSVFINPFFNFLQPPLTLKRLAQKQIAVIHDVIPLKYPTHFPAGIRGNINIFLNKLALKNYDLIITDSEASKKDIIKILGIKEDKIKVIYPCLPKIFLKTGKWKMGIETGQENRNEKLEKNPTSIIQLPNSFPNQSSNFCLYVGDGTWNKNLVNLAKAIKIINVTCVFVGKVFEPFSEGAKIPFLSQSPGAPPQVYGGVRRAKKTVSSNHPWQREFKQFIEETKNDKRFIFAGFVPDSQLLKLYQQTALNILPSRDEGFGFSFLEAAQFSCPSVLSGIPVLKEISAGSALFADPKNPNDIADKIGEIYFNKEIKNRLGEQAKKRSLFFSPEKFKKEFLSIIQKAKVPFLS